jgi:formate hydrogenlyase subunit 6/NADH:ubiquinone oxidoreductase subunit I
VQCGLCKATCPEKVISLKPQIDFRAATAASRVVKQEDPFLCTDVSRSSFVALRKAYSITNL